MTISHWQRDTVSPERKRFDVCVLGAGVAGAAVAWWLHKQSPRLRVCIVERSTLGSGASGRNAGMVLAGLADHYDEMVRAYGRDTAGEIWQATIDHRIQLHEFLEETGADVRLERCGSWRVGMERAESEHLSRSAALLEADGFPVEFRETDPLGRGFHSALGIKEDCGVHPLLLVQSLVAASGATLYEHAEVFAVEEDGGEVVIRTPLLDVRAAHAVVALNAYAGLLDAAWLKFVTPHRGQIFVTEKVKTRALDRLVYAHHGYVYFRQLPDNRFLLGGWRHEFAEDEAGYDDRVTPRIQDALENFMARYFPEASTARIEARWAGTMGFSPDGIPVVGRAPRTEKVFYLLGFTGHGFGLAFDVARRLVGLLLRDEGAGIFDARRFDYAAQ